ncbi:MAG: DUF3179 domain-containing protein [Gammaproteobacteria bacterium]
MIDRFIGKRVRVTALSLGLVGLIVYWLVTSVLAQTKLGTSLEWPKTDFDNAIVDVSEIKSGGPPKDGIPAVDEPKFVSTTDATEWLHAQEPVVVFVNGDKARAYPLQILMYHEIVNDVVGGKPVSVTFCPLCNATIVFDRNVEGTILDFGTTGRLRKSDLVMYDRQTESWWQQFSGQAIIGDYAGAKLMQLPATIIAFDDFKTAYPSGEVLSRDTGHRRPYGNNPYRGYDRVGDVPFLFDDPIDERLPAMERVISVTNGKVQRVYPFSSFTDEPVINDEVNDKSVVVFSKQGTLSALDKGVIAESREIPSAAAYSRELDGKTLSFEARDGAIVDKETSSQWNLFGQAVNGPLQGKQLATVKSGVHFAFAWLAFNPESEVYVAED